MALLDLSLVTRALSEFLARSIEVSPAWAPRGRPTVAPTPPDQMPGAGVSLYLYHVTEPGQHRSSPPPDAGSSAQRFTPMVLDLHYQLSVTPGSTSDTEMHQAQLLFGLAIKTLRDAGELNDRTQAGGTPIFALLGLDGAGNRFHPVMVQMEPAQAVNYWTAGASALRLSAYYTVSAVVLEPEAVTARAARVYGYAASAFPMGAPMVTGTEAEIAFTLPGGLAQRITVSPASVPYGGLFHVTGANFTGVAVDLALRGTGDPAPRVVDDLWAVQAQPNRITARAAETIAGAPLLPGAYMLQVRTAREIDGRAVSATSNTTVIQIAPAITAITPQPGGRLRIEGAVFAAPGLDPADVELRLGPVQLSRVAGAPGPGQFQIASASRIEVMPPASLPAGTDQPLRLHIRGAESPPNWVRLP